jgi:hypothetical protein
LKFEGDNRIVAQLADQVGVVINIPTFHIFGCNDAFVGGAVALYNVCDPTNSTMYDHGLGHIVPRDAENVQMLADIFEELIPRVEGERQMEDWREAENVRESEDVSESKEVWREPEAVSDSEEEWDEFEDWFEVVEWDENGEPILHIYQGSSDYELFDDY